MQENSVSQTILITGESGAGKTESSKHLIQFLCNHAATIISERIIDSTPLLEEFGNASTTKNRNSSRFCKFVEVSIFHLSKLASCNNSTLTTNIFPISVWI